MCFLAELAADQMRCGHTHVGCRAARAGGHIFALLNDASRHY